MNPSPSIGPARSHGPSASTAGAPSMVREAREHVLAANEFLVKVELLPRQANPDVPPTPQRDPPTAFWLAVESYRQDKTITAQLPVRAAGPTPADMEHLEREMCQRFGRGLRRALLDMAREETAEETPPFLSEIFFRPRVMSYSSLDLGVAISGIKALISFFGANADAFQLFLEQYVPAAFITAAGMFPGTPTAFDVGLSPGLIQQFAIAAAAPEDQGAVPSGGQATPAATTSPITVTPAQKDLAKSLEDLAESQRKARLLWLLANGSLLIPVLISVWLLLEAKKEIVDARVAFGSRSDAILNHYEKVLQAERARYDRTKRLEDALADRFVESLRQPPPPPQQALPPPQTSPAPARPRQ